MNMQDVTELAITEGDVRTIHDSNDNLLWGKLSYDTKYAGDTFQQTYSGKNLMPYNSYDADDSRIMNMPDLVLPIGTFTISFDLESFTLGTSNDAKIYLQLYDENGNGSYSGGTNSQSIYTIDSSTQTGRYSYTFTTIAISHYSSNNICLGSSEYSNGARCKIANIQIESGSTPTSYEPYTAGIPAPNPDYPQAVQTVTGTQTVTISDGTNSDSFTVNLGSIELCKIGDYQDYIYKSGDDWYVHKETGGATYDGSEDWTASNRGRMQAHKPNSNWASWGNDLSTYASKGFSNYVKAGNTSDSGLDNVFNVGTSNIFIKATSAGTNVDVDTWKTWLNTHNLVCYSILATPTDTKITDSTLISQLDGIHEWLTRYGYNSSVSGTLPLIVSQTNLS